LVNPAYTALIRTFNSARTLPDTLSSLEAQSIPPSQYIVVDSGSTDNTVDLIPDNSILHIFDGPTFNYADAINQGIKYVSTEYVMIVSSHTVLHNITGVEYALNLLEQSEDLGAAYFDNINEDIHIRYTLINRQNFSGFNGLWNTCSIIKINLLRRRNFNSDIFTAEDQEWAKWLFYCEKKAVARISNAGMDNSSNINGSNLRKVLNEYVAVAYFVKRDLLGLMNLARVGYRVVKPTRTLRLNYRLFNFLLLFRLLRCCFVKPKYKSKYF
jgi:glycosyltransferase involved in cell wall biosynthesis